MKSSLTALLASASIAAAHMEMSWPPPFRSKYNPYSNPGSIDYTMTAPLLADGTNFPCKNYQTADLGTPSGRPTATFAAGQAANLTIGGGAPHGGGSCQVSLSYDRGHSFTVVQSIEGGCPASAGFTNLDFSIPFDAPQGDALLAWTWFNNLGNREMYMNCAAVTISGSASQKLKKAKRAAHTPLNSRPKLFVANVGNGCSTVDSRDVLFPQPGPDLDVQSAQGAIAPKGNGCQGGGGGSAITGEDVAVPAAAQGAPKPASSAQSAGGAFVTVAPSAAASAAAAPAPATASAPAAAVAPAAAPAPAAHAVSAGKGSPQPGAAELVASSTAGSSSADAIAAGTACSSEGRWSCLHGGTSFQRCASGQWSVVQAMAAGTVCRVGQSDKFDIAAANAPAPATARARVRQLRHREWRAE